jgi:hypothetical protein
LPQGITSQVCSLTQLSELNNEPITGHILTGCSVLQKKPKSNMKIKSMKISNLFNYGKVEVNFDENVTFLIGKNGAGKSSIGITAIWAIMMGVAEKSKTALIGDRFRFIGNNALSGSGELVLHDEANNVDITVVRRITKSSNELSFKAPEGYPVGKEWLESLFNVFLIAPKKFAELTSKQQAEALGLDTSKIDAKIKTLKDTFTLINRDLTNIGQLVPVAKVEKVDVSKLNTEKNEVLEFNKLQEDKKIKLDKAKERISDLAQEAIAIEEQIDALKLQGNAILEKMTMGKEYISQLPKAEELRPLEAIDDKLNNATRINENAFKFEQYEIKLQSKKDIEAKITKNKADQATAQKERVDYIKGQKLPFDGLSISEDGELLLNGKPIKEPYFSTGELLRIIPVLMSSKNPELKYVFLQDFNLLDEDQQLAVEKALTDKGMQLVIELVGTKKVEDRSCILLKDCKVVEDYISEEKPQLI